MVDLRSQPLAKAAAALHELDAICSPPATARMRRVPE
jgi:hypothetical protein